MHRNITSLFKFVHYKRYYKKFTGSVLIGPILSTRQKAKRTTAPIYHELNTLTNRSVVSPLDLTHC